MEIGFPIIKKECDCIKTSTFTPRGGLKITMSKSY